MLEVCTGLDDYTRFCTVLTGFAESDFDSSAVRASTIGVFQQDPRWWPSATGSTADQCRAFVRDFLNHHTALHTGDPVHDCWITQRWAVPNGGKTWPDPGPGFATAPSTLNYSRRLPDIPRLLTGQL